jgi:GR25 family glycosyltransferase involved in LPS biosynthesis
MGLIDKVFVLHHKDLLDRKDLIEYRLKEESVDYEIIQEFHPNDINYEDYTPKEQNFPNIVITHPYGTYENFFKKITISELSLYLKHKYCFEKQIEEGYETILILEDDAKIPYNFLTILNNQLTELDEKNGDVLMMGECFNFKSKVNNGSYIDYDELNRTRCTHAILYKLNATKKIYPHINNITLPIDFKLNEIFQLEQIKVFWSKESIEQNNIFESRIDKV